MRRAVRLAAPIAAALAVTGAMASAPAPIHLRVNQVGYRPGDPKLALALTDRNLAGKAFEVTSHRGERVVHRGTVGRDRGRYARFAHLYEIALGPLSAAGTYVVRVAGVGSPPFAVGNDAHSALLAKSLAFFRVQRCGPGPADGHGACHVQDGAARGGPADGMHVRADGGWHDAGDYIKFLVTTGHVTNLLLATYLRHPDVFPDHDGDRIPDLLEEVRIGVEWIAKLWDAERGVLYYQVSDARDHDTWRRPEKDTDVRPVWACAPGQGGNVAGKAAASLALAAVIWSDRSRPYADPELARAWLDAAKQVYAWGKERPAAQPSNPPEFYQERSVDDNLALAAAALFRATGETAYLQEARERARAAGGGRALSWSDAHALAHYEIARADPAYVAEAKRHLEATLDAANGFAAADPFRVGLDRLHWGSAPDLMGVALQAFWYRDLTGDGRYLALALQQWDYLLGLNPWGVCFVNSVGTTWPRHPHHQIADITKIELVGFWNEGPVPRRVFEGRKLTLSRPDAYAAFQSEGAVYHDDKEDYVTNEPTLDANAAGLSLTAWYATGAR
jgi:endoglucanase